MAQVSQQSLPNGANTCETDCGGGVHMGSLKLKNLTFFNPEKINNYNRQRLDAVKMAMPLSLTVSIIEDLKLHGRVGLFE